MLDISPEQVVALIEAHHVWGAVIFGLLAFGESMAIIGVLLPATVILIAAGSLVATGTLPLWEVWVGGAIGGGLGDAVSYWLGRWLGPKAELIWPFRKNPERLLAAERAFQRWGWIIVFAGRFIGPLRATVPLAAGIFRMRHWEFQLVNWLSAIVWIPVLVVPGVVGERVLAIACGSAARDLFGNRLTGAVCDSRAGGLVAVTLLAFVVVGLVGLAVQTVRRRLAPRPGAAVAPPPTEPS